MRIVLEVVPGTPTPAVAEIKTSSTDDARIGRDVWEAIKPLVWRELEDKYTKSEIEDVKANVSLAVRSRLEAVDWGEVLEKYLTGRD